MNAPMAVRQSRLGHVESSTTMGYTHLVSEDDRLLSEKLGEILFANVRELKEQKLTESTEGLTIQ